MSQVQGVPNCIFFFRRLDRMASKTQQKILYAGIFIVGIVLVYMWSRMSGPEGFQDAASVGSGSGYRFVMYGVDWCPHCVKAKPEFEALGSTVTTGGGQVVVCEVVNPEKEPEKAKGKKIDGYPTIHLYDAQGSLVEEYSGPRTTEGFRQFLDTYAK